MSKKDKEIIKNILKVNHAGEFGAIRIYQGQLFIASLFCKDLKPFLKETLSHEVSHRRKFFSYMKDINVRPCYVLNLWGIGGFVLGISTAFLGKNSIMICTSAVESKVHEHLTDQKVFLKSKDDKLKELIEEIEIEELQHLEYAENNLKKNFLYKLLNKPIRIITEIAIWVSTYGAVSKMKKGIC